MNIVGKWKGVFLELPFGDLVGRQPLEVCAKKAADEGNDFMFDKMVLEFKADNTMTTTITEGSRTMIQSSTWWEEDGEFYYDSTCGEGNDPESGFTEEDVAIMNHLVVEGEYIVQNAVFAELVLEKFE